MLLAKLPEGYGNDYVYLSIETPVLSFETSRFSADTPLGVMIDELMVDQWNVALNYSAYYQQCQPLQCSYTSMVDGTLLYVLSTIVGLFGGLVTILKIFVPSIVRFARNRMRARPEVYINDASECSAS